MCGAAEWTVFSGAGGLGWGEDGSGWFDCNAKHTSQFQRVLVMLSARQGNALVYDVLVGAAQKCDQGVDDRIHVRDLVEFERCQAGRGGLVLCIAANPLQVGDRGGEFLAGTAGGKGRSVVEFAHVGVNLLYFCLNVLWGTGIGGGSGRGDCSGGGEWGGGDDDVFDLWPGAGGQKEDDKQDEPGSQQMCFVGHEQSLQEIEEQPQLFLNFAYGRFFLLCGAARFESGFFDGGFFGNRFLSGVFLVLGFFIYAAVFTLFLDLCALRWLVDACGA